MRRDRMARILFLLVAAAVIGYALVNMRSQTPAPTVAPLPVLTRIPPPPSLEEPFFLYESSFEGLDYDPETYPKFAAAYPDATCATWENGGVFWLATHEELGWLVQIQLPEFRFCGIPIPHAEKPENTTLTKPVNRTGEPTHSP
ncbi:MAG: hypothetical protein OXF83_10925 [Anaerolineaceae bacterium]|nr:hypothetical protein [Anaerolineaceae bacterium]